MGKYSSWKGKLTSFSEEEEYQEKVNTRKQEIRDKIELNNTATLTEYGKVLIQAKLEKARLESLVKDENLTVAALNQVLVEQLEDQSYSNLKFENGVTLSIKDDVYSKVTDKPKFHCWISETGNEDLLSVNYQTMNSLVKNSLLDNKPVPPGIDVYFKQSIAIRGMKGLNEQD